MVLSVRVLTLLPHAPSYVDRVKTYVAMCDYAQSVTLAARNTEELKGLGDIPPNFRVLEFGRHIERNRLVARFISEARAQRASSVVHEHFVGLGFPGAMAADPRSRYHKRVLSLYASTPDHLFSKASLSDWTEHLGARGVFYYLRLFAKRVAWEFPSCHLARLVICNSPDIHDGLRRYYRVRSKRIKVVATAVDTEHFRPRSTHKSELGYSEQDRILLYVGNLNVRKGIYMLLSAAQRLKSRNVPLKLVCLGQIDPFERDSIVRLRSAWGLEDYVELQGPVSRETLPMWYSMADAMVSPSILEASPRVVKEAASCGCPVIASDIAGTRMLDVDGSFIKFVPPKRPDLLAAAIEELLPAEDVRRAMGEKGRIAMKESHTPKRVAQQLVSHYQSLWDSLG
ncbi:MAG: glycosyltransferase family 4 protein [Anaerolineales bacterium]|jgi:glycosyltransferase involved in cell wall biosynthesis